MLKITCQDQEALEGSIVLLDSGLYATDGAGWVLRFDRPEIIAPELALGALHEREGVYLDWRILTAAEIDLHSGKFLPAMGRGYVDLDIKAYAYPADLWASVQRMAGVTGENSVDLTGMLRSGNVRARYDSEVNSGRVFAKEENIQSYTFRWDDRVLSLPGNQVRAFTNMGLELTAPSHLPEGSDFPVVSAGADGVQGFMSPLHKSGIEETDMGIPLPVDACVASWVDESKALLYLEDAEAHTPVGSLEGALRSRPELRESVGALLWRGWSVQEIEQAYEASREVAYCRIAEKLGGELEDCIQILTGTEAPKWRVSGAAERVKRICGEMEKIITVVDVDLRLLEDAVRLVGEGA